MKRTYLLGYDIGSSSVKASIVDAKTGDCRASSFAPKSEMEIIAHQAGWAEQDPQTWWDNLKTATREVFARSLVKAEAVEAIGISYQMHGLVAVDKNKEVLRPSIIWCDSRAVPCGDNAVKELGLKKCVEHLLNSPGNFTASKLRWVKENEPAVYSRIFKIMLPGDYIAMKLSGSISTTVPGLSEGILWDFKDNRLADFLLDYYEIDKSVIPDIVPTFALQSEVSAEAAEELGLKQGTKIAYRAGDQPNNAFSLNVLNPGEIAATAGTSGVVYGVSDVIRYDEFSRVNSFAHVNHSRNSVRLGVLLCINGTGILNSWSKRVMGSGRIDYEEMNSLASQAPIGSEGLSILPFGNGAERMLKNDDIGCHISGLNFNIHSNGHFFRAVQEGVACAFRYGMDIMEGMGVKPGIIRAGMTNMFLSSIFRDTLPSISGATIELYDTDGSQGAAKGAGLGIGFYSNFNDAFANLKKLCVIEPDKKNSSAYQEMYHNWLNRLNHVISWR
jgi:xylulokinase